MSTSDINPHKVSIWILRGGSAGVAFNLCLRRLLFGTMTAVVLCVAAAYTYASFSPSDEDLDEASLALLREYMSQRINMLEESREPALANNAQQAQDIEDNLDRKIKLLVDEIVRVRSYEKQLQTRAAVLESILNSTVELEEVSPLGPKQEAKLSKPGRRLHADEVGMGGAEVSLSPLFSVYPSLAKQFSSAADIYSLMERLELQIDQLNRVPIGTPVDGRMSSRFGFRRSPFNGRRHLHQGLDIAVTQRSLVQATADGLIVSAGYKGAYGKSIIIDHGNGLETVYAHLSQINVKVGQTVCRGQSIGLVGSTGRSTGPHVHYEVRVGGVPKDPKPFIQLASLLKSVK